MSMQISRNLPSIPISSASAPAKASPTSKLGSTEHTDWLKGLTATPALTRTNPADIPATADWKAQKAAFLAAAADYKKYGNV